MPLSSPGPSTTFTQIFPGAPNPSLQSLRSFVYRQKRYTAYISGCNLNILSSPNTLVQVLAFNSPLVAVLAESQDGKLVVASKSDAWVLKPEIEGWIRVWWERALLLRREDAADEVCWLSWGNEGEVLVGGTHALSLFSSLPSSRNSSPADTSYQGELVEKRTCLWSIGTSSPVLFAEFSPSASLIATCSRHDRLVKVWRRLSFEEGLFDYSYLRHPDPVTHIQWRRAEQTLEQRRGSGMNRHHDEDPEILYTIAIDGNLRVWKTGSHHDPEILVLHTIIDLVAAIPHSPTLNTKASQHTVSPRYMVTVPSERLCAAVDAAIGLPQNGKVNYALEHLKEIASKEPDIIIALDGQGRMSAWGLQSIGHKRRPQTPTASQPYHIAHAEELSLQLGADVPAVFDHWLEDDKFHLLAQAIGSSGDITWWEGNIENFLSPAVAGTERLALQGQWCGHTTAVSDMQSSPQGLLSWSKDLATCWSLSKSQSLEHRCSLESESNIMAASFLHPAKALLTISATSICLWSDSGNRVAGATCKIDSKGVICITDASESSIRGLFLQSNGKQIHRWTAQVSPRNGVLRGDVTISEVPPFAEQDDAVFAQATRDIVTSSGASIITVTSDGVVRRTCTTTKADTPGDFKLQGSFNTDVTQTCGFTANEYFAALVGEGGREFSIFDLKDGYMEYKQSTSESITSLVASTAFDRRNLLAVGLPKSVEVLVQAQYSEECLSLPTWIRAKTVSIADIGPSICSLAWVADGALALASGNAILVTDSNVEIKRLPQHVQETLTLERGSLDYGSILDVARHLLSIAPFWHPSLLSHFACHGQLGVAARILNQFAPKLKFWSVGDDLTLDFDDIVDPSWQYRSRAPSKLSDDTINDLRELLVNSEAPSISRREQRHLIDVIGALSYLSDHANGLDSNALAYVFNWRLQILAFEHERVSQKESDRPNGTSAKHLFVPSMEWDMCVLAYHSSSQQPLLDILRLHYDNKLTWQIARNLGLLSWLSDREAQEQVFEQLAQSAYRAEQPADPVNASLYFLALRKKPTLLGLWRIATWHKEQRTTMNFLKRDFTQGDAKTAARKNAYALMGKRRFEYSAAFFLLADDPQSAANALASQCEDVHLAIAVVRLYCGDGSTILKQLVNERLMPQARKVRNRWLMSWCYSVLGESLKAAEALVEPLHGARNWHQDDPLTLRLYAQLRKVPSKHEYDAVLRSAKILRRMGLYLPAMQLVATWEFQSVPSPPSTKPADATEALTNAIDHVSISSNSEQPEPMQRSTQPSILDSFSQLEPVASATDEKATREAKAAALLAKLQAKKDTAKPAVMDDEEKKKKKKKPEPEPTQFKEPDANSLLDSFGF